jgi:hypothetical protein
MIVPCQLYPRRKISCVSVDYKIEREKGKVESERESKLRNLRTVARGVDVPVNPPLHSRAALQRRSRTSTYVYYLQA